MSLHSDRLSWLRAKQSLTFVLNATNFAKKQEMPILYFDLTRSGLESTLYHTRRGHANYYITDAVQFFTEAPGDIHYNQYI
jgi:hypothetical protein